MEASNELLQLCNHCWEDQNIPKAWRLAKVVLLFKKGDASLPENYRPISLLPVGYKILAALIHQRLIDGGVAEKITASQFGFRPKRGTGDALMIMRRVIDAAHMANTGGISILLPTTHC